MAKKLAKIFGIVFIVVGLLGFFNNPVLGLFEVNTAHNVVHLLLGVILLWGAKSNASKVLKWVAIVYFVVALLGFFMASSGGMLLGFIDVNAADNWLHLVLALVLFWASMGGKKPMMPSSAPSSGGSGASM